MVDSRMLVLVVALTVVGCGRDTKARPAQPRAGAGDDGGAPRDVGACRVNSDCDDGLYCTGQETCAAGACQPGLRVTCNDGVACTIDRCSEALRSCQSGPPDADGDGHYDKSCKDKAGKSLGDDCDDADPLRFPGNIEVCDRDNRDDDCDPKTLGDKDSDADGFVDATCCNAESDTKGAKLRCGDDCDDRKPNVNPRATEACDGFDNDCNGKVDEGVSIKVYVDKDHDGHGLKGSAAVMKCAGTHGYSIYSDDCNDADSEVFASEFEICDGKDNNCDGHVDEVRQDAPWFVDADHDQFGDASGTPIYSCERIPGRVLSHDDCDDHKASVNPAAAELCDGVDDDCNGAKDFVLGINDFEDDDNDGVADAKCKGGQDCDDTDPSTGKGMEEVCDLRDNDCDGMVDEQTAQTVWYLDRDGDGWGIDRGTALARCEPIPGRSANLGDCDDTDNRVHPTALETCNGIDDNCNGTTDESSDYQCQLTNALSLCKSGACAVLSCYPGHGDCDGQAKNGCECSVVVAPLPSPPAPASCSDDSSCSDGDYCNGKEHCNAVDHLCYAGTPVNCAASNTVLQGSYVIRSSLDIATLAGIETITGDLSVLAKGLHDLTGLESLTTIGGKLIVDGDPNDDQILDGNQSLAALVGSGLINLTTVGGDVVIEDNPALTTIRLPSLVTAGGLLVRRNAALTKLDGFDQLLSVEAAVDISSNPLLGSIGGLQALRSAGSLSVAYNLLKELRLSGLVHVRGNLWLNSGAQPDSTLVKLDLPALTQVDGLLLVQYFKALTTISLPALTGIGPNPDLNGEQGIGLVYCDLLDDPDLHSLKHMGGPAGSAQGQNPPRFEMWVDGALKSLAHVPAIGCPSGLCTGEIDSNPMLSNCDAQALLATFTNFSVRVWQSNYQPALGGGCADGMLP